MPTAVGEIVQNIVLTGLFDGSRSSRLVMPIRLEKRFLDSCVRMPIAWQDPKNWERNTSAHSYSATWDDAELAMRFDVTWNDSRTDRWLYPLYRLDLPKESLTGAALIQFEVKSAQDRVENDFVTQNLALRFKDGTSRGFPASSRPQFW